MTSIPELWCTIVPSCSVVLGVSKKDIALNGVADILIYGSKIQSDLFMNDLSGNSVLILPDIISGGSRVPFCIPIWKRNIH